MSLFSRVTRFVPGAALNPRENRLTEILAAVVEEVDGLAQALVHEWLGMGCPEGSPHVTTQLATPRDFVDLEFRFGSFSEPEYVVWVENKHGSWLAEGQAEKYLQELAARPGPRRTRRVLTGNRSGSSSHSATIIRGKTRVATPWSSPPAPPLTRQLLGVFKGPGMQLGSRVRRRKDSSIGATTTGGCGGFGTPRSC